MNTKTNKKPEAPKFQPVLINSKDGLIATVNSVVADKLALQELRVAMDKEIVAINERYQRKMEPLLRDIATGEAGIQVYFTSHREELLPEGMKSLDLQLAVLGFRDTPHRVEKCRAKDTWDDIAIRAATYREYDEKAERNTFDEPPVTFNGEDFVRYPAPELNKKALLSDRSMVPSAFLKTIGVKFEYDELFYFEPKAETIEGVKEVAA